MLGSAPIRVLSVGSVEGGWSVTTKDWRAAISRLAIRVAELREGVESPINLNVIYQVPGSVLESEFIGVRTGRYSKKDRHLIVQVAIPPELPEDPYAFVQDALAQSVLEAESWARGKGIASDLSSLRRLAAAV